MIFKSLKTTVLFLLASFFYACSPTDVPDNLIPQEEMIEVLTETHLLEARVGRLSVNTYDSARVAFVYLHDELLEEHGVDSLIYAESYNYYGRNPKNFAEMYQKVEDKLTQLEEEYNGIKRSENE